MAVSVYDVGDAAPLRLLIDEADTNTVATVAVVSPTGHESTLAAVPNADRDEWTTALRLTEAGVWRTTWTVTGLGAGVEHHDVTARARATAARSYATTADLAAWPSVDTVPADADRLLARATRLVDRLMVGVVWRPADGTDNLPADPEIAGAYRDATCAQVAAWLEQGAGDYGPPDDDEGDAAELAAWARTVGASSLSLGPLTLGLAGTRSSSSTTSSASSPDYATVADEAVDTLRTAGLFPPHIGVVW